MKKVVLVPGWQNPPLSRSPAIPSSPFCPPACISAQSGACIVVPLLETMNEENFLWTLLMSGIIVQLLFSFSIILNQSYFFTFKRYFLPTTHLQYLHFKNLNSGTYSRYVYLKIIF